MAPYLFKGDVMTQFNLDLKNDRLVQFIYNNHIHTQRYYALPIVAHFWFGWLGESVEGAIKEMKRNHVKFLEEDLQ